MADETNKPKFEVVTSKELERKLINLTKGGGNAREG